MKRKVKTKVKGLDRTGQQAGKSMMKKAQT